MMCGAQATSLIIDNQTPGWLSSKINYSDQLTVENLTLSGYLNGVDFQFISELNKLHNLCGKIDLSSAHIVAYSGDATTRDNVLKGKWFKDCKHIDTLIFPSSCQDFDTSGFNRLNDIDNIIINCPNLEEVGFIGSNVHNIILYDGVKSLNMYSADTWDSVVWPSTLQQLQFNSTGSSKRWIDCKNRLTIHSSVLNPEDIDAPKASFIGDPNGLAIIRNAKIIVPIGTRNKYLPLMDKSVEVIEDIYPESILIDKSIATLFVGENLSLTAQIFPKESLHNELKWVSSNPAVADVDDSGMIQGLSYGKCSISVLTENGLNDAFDISVFNHVEDLIIPETIVIAISETSIIEPVIYPIGKTNSEIVWESSNSNIAFVDENGAVTGRSKGSCEISATSVDGNFSAVCQVSVVTPVEDIVVTLKSATVKVGESISISARIYPEDAYDKRIIWSSSDESIATVNSDGRVTALSSGLVQIYAISNYNNEIRDVCEVTILQPVTGISLDKSEVELIEDESLQLIAEVVPSNASNKNVNWTSSDVSVAMVSPNGTVYAVKEGQASIMVTTVDGGFVALCKVNVKAKTVLAESLSLSAQTLKLSVSEKVQLVATLQPENVTNKSLHWSSTDSSIATVSDNGLVTGISEGNAQIIVTTTDGSNIAAICDITVEKKFISIVSLSINPSSLRIVTGAEMAINAIITPGDATNQNLKWYSTNPNVASISNNGVITALQEGNTTIIATTQDGSNLSATCQVEVYKEQILVSSIELNPQTIYGEEGDTYQIVATILPDDADNKTIVWYSNNIEIASVDYNGIVTLKSKGSAVITATSSDSSQVKAECNVIVSEKAGIDEILIDKEAYVKIYSINGVLIYQGVYSQSNLVSGTYIILIDGKALKSIIR